MSNNPEPPTGAQLEILEVLAEAGPLTAAEVWARMSVDKEIARTTVITLLQRLESRGWLVRAGAGRGAVYRSLHTAENATASIADGFLGRYFDGSASKLVHNLLGEGKLSAGEVARLREILDEAEKS